MVGPSDHVNSQYSMECTCVGCEAEDLNTEEAEGAEECTGMFLCLLCYLGVKRIPWLWMELNA